MTIRDRKVIALIPARGGSKGVPGKNMRKVNGVPLIGYTVKAACDSKLIDDVYLSSDDQDILQYAEAMGINSIRRPDAFAHDSASANQVIEHFIAAIKLSGRDNFHIIYLQPTSPLRTAGHIDDAIRVLEASNNDSLISVVRADQTPFKSFILDGDGCLDSLFGESYTNSCRQDLPDVYFPNGAIYIFSVSSFRLNKNTIPSNGSIPFLMSDRESLDIDTEADFRCLNRLIQVR